MSQLDSSTVSFRGPYHDVSAYLTRPRDQGVYPGLVLIHEIWGLVPHIRSVADRFASEGFVVLAPDLMGSDPKLAPMFAPSIIESVTKFMFTLPPGKMRDQAFVQQELTKLPEGTRAPVGMFFATVFGGKLPFPRFTVEVSAAHSYLKTVGGVNASMIGSVGFCFGGTMSFRLACGGATQACVVFYGQNPDPIDEVAKINCPVLGNYGGEDSGLNATLDQLVAAMVRHKKSFEMKIYPGAPHAFFNETNTYMYRKAAAEEAWERSLRFLNSALKQGPQ